MPLIKGFTQKSIQKNIKTEIANGKTPKQSEAIAYRVARKAKKNSK
jgi:hypothetical protein